MIYFVSGLHVLLCVFMIFVILLQPGKDAGMGAALGGGAATSAFGGRGAVTFLGKVTAVCAIGYFITSLGLSYVGLKGSVASQIAEEAAKEAPAVPGAPSPAAGSPADAPKPPEGAVPADAPKPVEGAVPADAPKPVEGAAPADAPKPVEGAAPAPSNGPGIEKASDNPGKPVPSVPNQPVKGLEAGP